MEIRFSRHLLGLIWISSVFLKDLIVVDNRINNIVKGYKSSSNNRINNLSNIDIIGNRKLLIVSDVRIKKKLRSADLFNDIMLVVFKRQHILFNKFKINLSRNVNADNTVGQPSRANADPITDPSGIG
ncbi:hypothetical protein BCR32DRAFT_273871 [Anaeromyces robustus]|uniref:Uncharacterized protein n=1 Tax=Anaeromyces robustus TaxID=1754192 RepID=A0A1Y1XRC5_9FUNG|nr:hypothetical protein BCR32DRAFT_273871 [Anaeromyces robustus]|eukprot:ORX88312.1 hypothetical protein BCR32DRAFT_273871 [Anaeromyces robustus]